MPASQVSASQSSVAVQKAPRLLEPPFNNNLDASSKCLGRCTSFESPVPYSPLTYLTNRGNGGKSIPPLKMSRTNSYFRYVV